MILFVSDLHLSPATPGAARIFHDFVSGPQARGADGLYILGDLFEVWAGDDDLDDPFNARIATALRDLASAGVEVGIIRGNRDFLLGEDFARRTGTRLLADPFVLSQPAWQFVLSHGDALCTDDRDYQAFRAQVRDPAWQQAFLAQPLARRKAIAAGLREQSEAAKRAKSVRDGTLMDVNPAATDDFLRQHGYATLIHGHTHRPARHDHLVDGIHCERWVLGDWDEDRGDALAWDGTAISRLTLT